MRLQEQINQPDVAAFATELHRQHFAKRDFIADVRDFRLSTDQGGSLATVRGVLSEATGEATQFAVTDHAHGQIAGYCDIPKAYYDRMLAQQHALLDDSVYTWLHAKGGNRRTVRTLDGKVRAFLSDRYRRIDNYDLANVILPELQSLGAVFKDVEVTEKRMYIKVAFENSEHVFDNPVNREVGDRMFLGLTIRNSEVGCGKVEVLPMSLILSCKNGATHNELGASRRHVGSRIELGDDDAAVELYSNEALEADDRALMLKVRDTVRATASNVVFDKIIGQMRESMGLQISTAPSLAVQELGKTVGLQSSEEEGILQHLILGGTLTQWGMVNAITRFAQDVPDYDRRDSLEEIGGDVLAMAQREFGKIATASEPRRRRGNR